MWHYDSLALKILIKENEEKEKERESFHIRAINVFCKFYLKNTAKILLPAERWRSLAIQQNDWFGKHKETTGHKYNYVAVVAGMSKYIVRG